MPETIEKLKNIRGLKKASKKSNLDFNMRKWDGFDNDIEKLKEKTFASSGAAAIKIAVKEKIQN